MESTSTSGLFELQLDHEASAFLKDTAKWAKFLAIIGFVFCGILALAAIFGGGAIASRYSSAGIGFAGMGALITVLYLGGALLYFFPCLYTFNFAKKMQAGLRNNDQESVNGAFRNLRASYRYMGILTVVMLSFWVIALIFAGIGGAMR